MSEREHLHEGGVPFCEAGECSICLKAEKAALAASLQECVALLADQVGHGNIWNDADALLRQLDLETKAMLHLRMAIRHSAAVLASEITGKAT